MIACAQLTPPIQPMTAKTLDRGSMLPSSVTRAHPYCRVMGNVSSWGCFGRMAKVQAPCVYRG